jgi:hypothetical protein
MSNKKRVVVSFADGVGNYAKAMLRLELSLKQVGFNSKDDVFKGINDYAHIGSPFHKGSADAVPYAFKAYSIKKAIEEGADLILWCDSVVYATKSIEPIFNHIEEHGYLFFNNRGFSIGDYTSDACLEKWEMSREEAFNSKMIMGCCMGFDVHNAQAKEFLDKYIDAAADGISYMGSWTNENLQVSRDLRCKGTRHDQSLSSVLIKQMGLDITDAQSTYFAYAEHKGKIDISDNVGLWSEGI